MSSSYKFRNPDGLYFVTFSVVRWIDVFSRREYKDIVVDSINYCIKAKGLKVYAWVIMSNHVHMIVNTTDQPLQSILRDLKRHTSKAIIKAIEENTQESRRDWMLWFFEREGKGNANNETYQFWQQGNHPIELITYEVTQQKLDYLHGNPVKAGWVDEPENYLYSSARDYAGGKGFVEVILI
ncbi:transposase [Mucilaginibacter conchicola]|uniref:Transposase n=1 Tax=Mucilaginibacter conchicola TaxID=2303333 RepID=A0A372P1S4_9SPHI|nr:transposase [Mucilaginibacter conchicola]RFZ95697.1 transposase [Mucilaginibacter conchicola]